MDVVVPVPVDGKASRGILWPDGTTEDVKSRKKDKEAEDARCLGGLRAPWKSLDVCPGWYAVGQKIRSTLGPLVAESGVVLAELGTPQAHDFERGCVERARTALRGAFALATDDVDQTSGIDAELCRTLIVASGDPDLPVAKWLEAWAPLGIVESIACRGCDGG
eukprot:3858680-Amphidinium_carterae.2